MYDSNSIHARPMKPMEVHNMFTSFKDINSYFIKHNFNSKLHVMNNECSHIVNEFIINDINTELHFSKTHLCKVNTAKQVVKNFNYYFISWIYIVRKLSPFNYGAKNWYKVLDLLQASRLTPHFKTIKLLCTGKKL